MSPNRPDDLPARRGENERILGAKIDIIMHHT